MHQQISGVFSKVGEPRIWSYKNYYIVFLPSCAIIFLQSCFCSRHDEAWKYPGHKLNKRIELRHITFCELNQPLCLWGSAGDFNLNNQFSQTKKWGVRNHRSPPEWKQTERGAALIDYDQVVVFTRTPPPPEMVWPWFLINFFLFRSCSCFTDSC